MNRPEKKKKIIISLQCKACIFGLYFDSFGFPFFSFFSTTNIFFVIIYPVTHSTIPRMFIWRIKYPKTPKNSRKTQRNSRVLIIKLVPTVNQPLRPKTQYQSQSEIRLHLPVLLIIHLKHQNSNQNTLKYLISNLMRQLINLIWPPNGKLRWQIVN